jgi:hypothetical protein
MLTNFFRLSRAARREGRSLAMLCVLLATAGICRANVEPLPSVPQELNQAPVQPDAVWTPYGAASVTRAPAESSDEEPCYPGDFPPTGFEDDGEDWRFTLMPKSLIWHSYLAGVHEPRFASVWSNDKNEGWQWDVALGGRVSMFRYGSKDKPQPDGWELQLEGAAMPQLDPEHSVDVNATDYRVGVPLVYGNGPYQMKFGFYHISSHLGDEFMIRNPTVERINFGRNAIAWGHSYYTTPDLRLYGEIDWAWDCMFSEPWNFQFGFDYAPILRAGNQAAPFIAMNCQLYEELDFSGSFTAQTGWAWRYGADRRMFRVGLQYYTGNSQQYEFYKQYSQTLGLGLWYDY